MPPDWSDCSLLVMPEQAPICLFTDDNGGIVITQQHWRECEDEVFITVRPENVRALCRAIFKEAGIDPDTEAREVGVKDATANERQRRHRDKLRDGRDQASVTVTAKLANDVDETSHERGTPAAD